MAPLMGNGVTGAIIALYKPAGVHAPPGPVSGLPGFGVPSFQAFRRCSKVASVIGQASTDFAHSYTIGINAGSSPIALRLIHASTGVPPQKVSMMPIGTPPCFS